MSNLAAPRNTFTKPLDGFAEIDVALAAVRVYRGGAIGIISGTGYARPILYNDTTYRFYGVSLGNVDNSAGSVGDKRLRIATRGLFAFAQSGLTVADLKKTVYFTDDHTVSLSSGTMMAGTLEQLDSDGTAWVRIRPFGTAEAQSSTDFGAGPVLSDVFAASTGSTAVSLNQSGATAVILGTTSVTGVQLFADQPLLDSAGNELVKFIKVSTAVNELTISNNSTGVGPILKATGETNVPITLAGKGTGPVNLGQATTTGVVLLADQPINDSSGNELIKFVKTTTAVNEVTITNQATGVAPSITASGETNVGLRIGAKATATVMFNTLTTEKYVVTTVSATGATTITAAQLLGGYIVYSGNGAATHTLPTGTQLCTALPGYATGDSFIMTFRNTGNNTLTIAGDTGTTTFAGNTLTIATVTSKSFLFVNTGANTWDFYVIAAFTH